MIVTSVHSLRVGGAFYQYFTGKLNRSCFDVSNGKIFQTPFTSGCLREVDYAIMVIGGCWLILFIPTLCWGLGFPLWYMISTLDED